MRNTIFSVLSWLAIPPVLAKPRSKLPQGNAGIQLLLQQCEGSALQMQIEGEWNELPYMDIKKGFDDYYEEENAKWYEDGIVQVVINNGDTVWEACPFLLMQAIVLENEKILASPFFDPGMPIDVVRGRLKHGQHLQETYAALLEEAKEALGDGWDDVVLQH